MNLQIDRKLVAATSDVVVRDQLPLLTAFEAPHGGREVSLAELWAFTLRVDRIGRNDDFFELGGDSFSASVIATQIEAQFGVSYPPAHIIGHSTVALQAKQLSGFQRASRGGQLTSSLIGCHTSGRRPPLFLVHGKKGLSFFNNRFFERLGVQQPVYLFQAPGMDGVGRPLDTVGKIACKYVVDLRAVQPEGPYNIGAFCEGALIAFEMCLLLQRQGQSVQTLLLIDPPIVPKGIADLYPEVAVLKKRHAWLGPFPIHAKRLLARLVNFFTGRGFSLKSTTLSWQGNLKATQKRQENRLREINRRRASGKLFEDELKYDPQVMVNVSMELDKALSGYVPTTPFGGHAHFLVNSRWGSATVRDDLFWTSHLGSFDCEILAGDHDDFFDKNILLVADFVKRRMDDVCGVKSRN